MKDMSISHLQEEKKTKIKSYAKIGKSIAAEIMAAFYFVQSQLRHETVLENMVRHT